MSEINEVKAQEQQIEHLHLDHDAMLRRHVEEVRGLLVKISGAHQRLSDLKAALCA